MRLLAGIRGTLDLVTVLAVQRIQSKIKITSKKLMIWWFGISEGLKTKFTKFILSRDQELAGFWIYYRQISENNISTINYVIQNLVGSTILAA